MKIQNVDKNFIVGGAAEKNGMNYYSIPNENFALYGVFYDAKTSYFMRMDGDVAKSVSDNVGYLCKHTSGGRIRFATNSKKFEIKVTYNELWSLSHMALEGSGGFMLTEDLDDGSIGFYKMLPPHKDQSKGYELSINLPGDKIRNYTLWFPLYNEVTSLTIGLEENAIIKKGRSYKDIKPILYYGSSITQGGCASRPDNCYQGFIAKWNNVDFINLGFSGSGKAEDSMVDYLTKIDCSLFVCDYDHNATDAEYLKNTHYRLYERYRAVKKDVPILFISSPNDAFKVNTEMPLRKKIIKETYQKAIKNGDKNVYFLDGEKLVGKADRESCFVDGAHPTDLGFYRIAKKINKKINEILNLNKQ